MEFAIGDRVKIKNRDIIGFVVEYTKDNTTGDHYYILETLVLVPDSLPVIRINTKLLVYKKVLTRLDENVDV